MRLSYTKNGSGTEIIEENNFYPFGLKHQGYNAQAGNGGGSNTTNDSTPKSKTGPGVIRQFINWLFGGKKTNKVTVGIPEGSFDRGTRLFGLIRNANVNANGESPLEQHRGWRDDPMYHEGESWADRFARNVNSSHMEIMLDEGSGGGLMYGGFGRGIAAAEEISMTAKIAAEAEANGILSTQRGINSAKVAEYFEQMSNGTYNPTGGAGYIYEGKYILTDGNHRMNAAIQHGIESGNFKYIEQLINKGNFIRRNPLIDNYKVYKLPVK